MPLELDARCAAPIRYVQGNIVIGRDGRACALYRLPTFTYRLLPDLQKWGLLTALASIVSRAQNDVSFYVVNRLMTGADYPLQAAGLRDARFADEAAWHAELEGHAAQIDTLAAFAPEVYLRISLSPRADTQDQGAREWLATKYRALTELLSVAADAPIGEHELEARVLEEERLMARIAEVFHDARRATADEITWLCMRAPMRGVAEPELDPWWEPSALVVESDGGLHFTPDDADWLRLFNAAIHRPPGLRSDHVVVDAEGRGGTIRTYQAFLALGALPRRVEFPGDQAELMFAPRDGLDFPVDVVFHGRSIANEQAIREIDKAITDAENAIKEALEGGHTPDNVELDAPEQGRVLKDRLTSGDHQPMMHGGICFAVSATSQDEMRRRVDALANRMRDIKLHQPPGLQELLYYDHLIQPGGGIVPDYREKLTLEQVGMLMPVADTTVGSPTGLYAGYTIRSRRRAGAPVLVDPLAPSEVGETPSINIVGRQGSGKTFWALLLARACALRGSYVLTADPSPDHHLHELPELRDMAQVIALVANERYRGQLDPLVVTPEELREEIALSYYLEVLPHHANKGAWETELTRAVRAVMRRGRGGSQAVLNALRTGTDGDPSPEALQVADALALVADSGLGILGFGDGANVQRLEDLKRVTTIQMGNVTLPARGSDPAHWTRSARIGSATFRLVGAYMMGLVKQADRTIHKFVLFDEAWRLTSTDEGAHNLNESLRIGRKFNATVALLGQGVVDNDELRKLIGEHFLFGTNTLEEAQEGLRGIGCDPEDTALASRIADRNDFCRGRCLYRDRFGRVAEMQTDAVYDHVVEVLRTEPRDESAVAEVDVDEEAA